MFAGHARGAATQTSNAATTSRPFGNNDCSAGSATASRAIRATIKGSATAAIRRLLSPRIQLRADSFSCR